MQITLALLADSANRAESGKLNMLGVFHAIRSSAVPFQHPIMALVLELEASALDRGIPSKLGIQLIDEDGHAVITLADQPVLFPTIDSSLTPNVQFIMNLVNVQFERFGSYRFEILVDGKCIGNVPLLIASI